MRRSTLLLLLLLLAWGAFSGFHGLTTRDLHTWDEGVYYDEGRFLVQLTRVAPQVLTHRLSAEQAREQLFSLPPRMTRPLNAVLSAIAISTLGERVWAPGVVAVLAGLMCLYLTFLITRRLAGDAPALAAVFFLSLSPYFLTYRRLGLAEAPATAAVLFAVWLVIKWQPAADSPPPRRRLRLQTLALGLLCGLAFGINSRVLMLLPWVIFWRGLSVARVRGRGWLHGAAILGTFCLTLCLYQLPYLLAAPLLRHHHFTPESYFAQLWRFTTSMQSLRPEVLGSGYWDVLWMAVHYGLPVAALALVGLVQARRCRDHALLMAASLLVLPALQNAVLIPYLRFNCWLTPVVAMLAGYGGVSLARRVAKQRGAAHAVVLSALFVLLVALADGPASWTVMQSRTNHQAALQYCRASGATCVLTTNLSAAQAHAPLFRLEVMRQMDLKPETTLAHLRALQAQGPTLVVLESHQYMNGSVMMTTGEYAQSAAALLARHARPLWQAPHLPHHSLWMFLEHNKYLTQTLAMHAQYGGQAERIAVYDGVEMLRILEQAVQTTLKDAVHNEHAEERTRLSPGGRGSSQRGERAPPQPRIDEVDP